MRHTLATFVPLAVVACCLPVRLQADDFRIETKVYLGRDREPVSETTTLFRAGYVYDYMSGSGRVAVFDRVRGRFIVLDPARKLRAEVKTDEIRRMIDAIRELAAKHGNAKIRFAADPKFDIEFGEDGSLTLSSAELIYEVQTEPAATPDSAAQYQEFADWYARLNTISNRGSPPPSPRLVVNAELAERGLVPTEVVRTVPHEELARSEHMVSWRLLEGDHRRIAETANQLATFKLVEFRELLAPAISKR